MGRIVRIQREVIGLYFLVDGLNKLRKGYWKEHGPCEHRGVWESVERIVIGVTVEARPRKGRSILSNWMAGGNKPSLENAQRSFQWLSKQYPVDLTIDLKRTSKGVCVYPGVRAHDSKSHSWLGVALLHILWEEFFGKNGYERFKTCQRCGDWFIDQGRNKRGAYCSIRCGTRWWTREERRKAGHSQYTGPKGATRIRRAR